MNKFILPFGLTLMTAIFITWYGMLVKKYESFFVTSLYNVIAFSLVCVYGYFYDGDQALVKLQSSFKIWYIIPYVLLIGIAHLAWFFISKNESATYAAIFESIYPAIMILIAISLGDGKFDLKFLFGVLFICIGIIIIQFKK